MILGSGVAGLACAAGLVHPRSRRAAGWASAALLVGVYPGNLKMAADSTRTRSTRFKAIAFGRLPLQRAPDQGGTRRPGAPEPRRGTGWSDSGWHR